MWKMGFSNFSPHIPEILKHIKQRRTRIRDPKIETIFIFVNKIQNLKISASEWYVCDMTSNGWRG